MDKTEFVKDFIEFNSEIKKSITEIATGDAAMLYAVYRKDIGQIGLMEIATQAQMEIQRRKDLAKELNRQVQKWNPFESRSR